MQQRLDGVRESGVDGGLKAADEVEVTVYGTFTTHHHIQITTGILVELTLSAFGSRGMLHTADGRELTVCCTHPWRGYHELREEEIVLGMARPRGFFHTGMFVQFGGQEYVLRPASFWARTWCLTDRAGTRLLEIRPRGILRRGACLAVMNAVGPALLAFVYYLVHTRWQRDMIAAAAAASAAAAVAAR